MTSLHRRGKRTLAALITTALVAALSTIVTPAIADTKPASSSTPTTVSADSLSTAQLANGVGYAQVVIGNTVYVGGSFTGARDAGASSSSTAQTRYNLLSYNLTTGALNSFAPQVNGLVRGLAASPDGSTLYVAGAFTTVNGTTRNRIAALNPTTGALITSFAPTVNSQVNVVAATATTVYFGGQFTTVNSTARTRAAAVSASTGALTSWAPSVSGGGAAVLALELNASAAKVALSGTFSTIDGASGVGFGIVDSGTGGTLTSSAVRGIVTDGSTTSAIYGLSSDSTNVYGSGYYSQSAADGSGNLEGTFAVSWSTGALTWLEDCHGDEYDSAVLNGALYVVGHPHYCYDVDGGFSQSPTAAGQSPVYQRAIAFSLNATSVLKHNTVLQPRYYDFSGQPSPSLLDWFPTLKAGTFTGQSQAAWNITASGNYLLLTGEFPTVNGGTQYGIARFALPSTASNKVGPQLSGSSFPVNLQSLTAGSVRVSWLTNYDLDNENLTYSLYRGTTLVSTQTAASRIWYQRPTLSFTDTGLTAGTSYSYHVVATDPWGNTATGATAKVTVASTSVSSYARQVIADGATSYWRLGETSGTTIADSAGGYPATVNGAVTLGVAGAISGDSNSAASFDGASTTGIASNAYQGIGDTVSVAAWFKTTSTTGGQVIGAGTAKTTTTSTITPPGGTPTTVTADSSNHDREISVTSDGHVTFTVDPGEVDTITSAKSGYNDGTWHQVVGTVGPAGEYLYVDGALVASTASVTRALGLAMYWRIGGQPAYSTSTVPGTPAPGNYFTGSIDEPAVYVGTQLTAAQVANQYTIGTGQ